MIGCIVLAAGKGERMGGLQKAQLRLPDGRTFLGAILEAAGDLRTVVVGRNARAHIGMISSIQLGLDQLEDCEAALVWPVDTPLVRPSTVERIAAASAAGKIVIPKGGGHPTSFGRDLWPELRRATSARDVVRAEPGRVVELDVGDPGVRVDVDTPGDYAKIR